jgi:hypothetical protein
MTRIHCGCLLLALLLVGCQLPAANRSDILAGLSGPCTQGETEPCDPGVRPPATAEERPTAEDHATQIQRDVAAIIRGMRQTSASNGL